MDVDGLVAEIEEIVRARGLVAYDGELGTQDGQRGQFEQGGGAVYQQLDTLAGEQPAAVTVTLGVRRATSRPRELQLLVEVCEGGQLTFPVAQVGLAGCVPPIAGRAPDPLGDGYGRGP